MGSSTASTPALEARPKPTFSPSSMTVARGAAARAAVALPSVEPESTTTMRAPGRCRSTDRIRRSTAAAELYVTVTSAIPAPWWVAGVRERSAGRAPRSPTALVATSAKRCRDSSASNQPARARPPSPSRSRSSGPDNSSTSDSAAAAGSPGAYSRPQLSSTISAAPPFEDATAGLPLARASSTAVRESRPVGAVQQAPGAADRRPRVGDLAQERHTTLQVRAGGPLAQLGEETLALGVHGRAGDRQAQTRDALRGPRHRLECEVGARLWRQRAEHEHLGILRARPLHVVGGQVDAGGDHRQTVAQAAAGVEVARHRLGARRHAVGARDRGAHQPRHGRARQEVLVAHQQRRPPPGRDGGRRGDDRGVHPPGDEQVGADLARQPADVAPVAGKLAAGRQPLAQAAARIERPRAQLHDLHALAAGLLGQRSLGAGEHQSAPEPAGEVEQRALRTARRPAYVTASVSTSGKTRACDPTTSGSAAPAAVVLFVLGVLLSGLSIRWGINPHDEGLMLQAGERIADGQLPYRDFYANYGPGQYFLIGGLDGLFGPSLMTWRIVRVLLDAGVAVLAYVLVRRDAPEPLALGAWLAVAAAMAYPSIPHPNPTALALAFGALLLADRRPALAGGLAGLAMVFRLDLGAAALAGVVLLAWRGRPAAASAALRGRGERRCCRLP